MSVFRRLLRVTFWQVFLLVATAAFALDFVVTNNANSGPGSLRRAIENVNTNGTASNRILFNIPGPGVKTIDVDAVPLPVIVRNVEIDGTSQGDTSAGPLIEIIGNGTIASGLQSTQNLVLRRLAIGGFPLHGVSVEGTGSLFGNYIGVRADGVTADPNWIGVAIGGDATIGGLAPGEANVISGNQAFGIDISLGNATVRGNLIGLAADGATALPNGFYGIRVATSNGESQLISENTITGHALDGVFVANSTNRVRISANSMFSNANRGIHLYAGEANDNQASPVISGAYSYPAATRVVGTLNSVPSESFIVELFSNPVSERQGRTYLGQVTVNTDAGGAASFDTTLASSVTPGQFITATAIRDSNGNTSEFSTDVEVVAPGTISFDSATFSVNESGGVVNLTFTRSGGSDGAVQVDLNITGGSATTGSDYTAPAATVSFADGVTSAIVPVSITADQIDELNETVTFSISNPTNGAALGAQSSTTLTIVDDDTAGISIAPASVTTTEAGGSDSFDVVLQSQPTADVSIGISSSDTTEGTVSGALLTFTPADWNVAKSITVTGVDDVIVDGNVVYSIVTAAATSADAAYNGIDAANVSATNDDNDVAGINVTPASVGTTEAGGTDSFTIVLTSQPSANVSIGISSSDTTEGTASSAGVTFTSADWNVAQTIIVTGVNDSIDDGDVGYSIVTAAATSADPNYNGVDPADVAATNTDDDGSGISVAPASVGTTESGGTDTFTVVLQSEPTADVSIGLSSSDTTEGTVSSAVATFTPANWNVAQTFTVTGVDDAIDDGDVAYTIVTAAATSSDASYNGIDPANVAATNTDDDGAGIFVDPLTIDPSEGGTRTFTVRLLSQPTGNVTIGLSSSSPGEGTASPASLTFTPDNWNVPQTVTVTIPDDEIFDGPQSFTIILGAATSSDPAYDGLDGNDVTVNAADDESMPVISIGDASPAFGGTAVFTVTLSVASANPVTVNWATADGTGTAGSTYVAASGTVTFAPGETTATISVQTSSGARPGETFFVNLSAPSGGTLGDAQGQAVMPAAAIPTLSTWMLLALACAIALISAMKLHG